MATDLDWGCVTQKVDEKRLFRAICTCALLVARLTKSKGATYRLSDELGKAADSRDGEAIGNWSIENVRWREIMVGSGTKLPAIQQIIATLAKRFEPF